MVKRKSPEGPWFIPMICGLINIISLFFPVLFYNRGSYSKNPIYESFWFAFPMGYLFGIYMFIPYFILIISISILQIRLSFEIKKKHLELTMGWTLLGIIPLAVTLLVVILLAYFLYFLGSWSNVIPNIGLYLIISSTILNIMDYMYIKHKKSLKLT